MQLDCVLSGGASSKVPILSKLAVPTCFSPSQFAVFSSFHSVSHSVLVKKHRIHDQLLHSHMNHRIFVFLAIINWSNLLIQDPRACLLMLILFVSLLATTHGSPHTFGDGCNSGETVVVTAGGDVSVVFIGTTSGGSALEDEDALLGLTGNTMLTCFASDRKAKSMTQLASTMPPEMITDFSVCGFFFDLIKIVTTVILCRCVVSELIKAVMEVNPIQIMIHCWSHADDEPSFFFAIVSNVGNTMRFLAQCSECQCGGNLKLARVNGRSNQDPPKCLDFYSECRSG